MALWSIRLQHTSWPPAVPSPQSDPALPRTRRTPVATPGVVLPPSTSSALLLHKQNWKSVSSQKNHWEKLLWAKVQLRKGGTRTVPAFGQLRNFPLPQWNRDGKKWDFLGSECPIKWQFPSKELKLFKTSLFLTVLSVTRGDSALFTALFSVLCNQPLKFPKEIISAFIHLQSSVLNECLEQNLGFLK